MSFATVSPYLHIKVCHITPFRRSQTFEFHQSQINGHIENINIRSIIYVCNLLIWNCACGIRLLIVTSIKIDTHVLLHFRLINKSYRITGGNLS